MTVDCLLAEVIEEELPREDGVAISVFEHPRDYPEHYVARVFVSGKPSDVVVLRKELKELKDDIEQYTDLVYVRPFKLDDPCVVATYTSADKAKEAEVVRWMIERN